MGLFDNFLKAVESGELEKRLNNVADKVEKVSDKLTANIEKVADTPKKVVDASLDQTPKK